MQDVTIEFPQEKYEGYLKKLGLSSSSEFGMPSITQAFLFMINDFKLGKISIDKLSVMSKELLFVLYKVAPHDSEIEFVRDACEMYFDIRTVQDPLLGAALAEDLKRVLDYYDKNKFVISEDTSKQN